MPFMTNEIMAEAERLWNEIADYPPGSRNAERARILTADYLYEQQYYQSLRDYGLSQMAVPDGTPLGRAIEVLTSGNRFIETTPSADKIAREQERHRRLRAALQPQPPPTEDSDDEYDPAPPDSDDDIAEPANDDDDNDRDVDREPGVFSDDDSDLPFAAREGAGHDLSEGEEAAPPSVEEAEDDDAEGSPYPNLPSDEPVAVASSDEFPPIPGTEPGEVALRPGEPVPDESERRRDRSEGRDREEARPVLEEAE
jgi:hypothetical protein